MNAQPLDLEGNWDPSIGSPVSDTANSPAPDLEGNWDPSIGSPVPGEVVKEQIKGIIEGPDALDSKDVILEHSESITEVTSIPEIDSKGIEYKRNSGHSQFIYKGMTVENAGVQSSYGNYHIITPKGDLLWVDNDKILKNNKVSVLTLPERTWINGFTTLNGEDILVYTGLNELTLYSKNGSVEKKLHKVDGNLIGKFKLDEQNNIYYIVHRGGQYYLVINETEILLDEMKFVGDSILHHGMNLEVTSPLNVQIKYYEPVEGKEFKEHTLNYSINKNAPQILEAREKEKREQEIRNEITRICDEKGIFPENLLNLLELPGTVEKLKKENAQIEPLKDEVEQLKQKQAKLIDLQKKIGKVSEDIKTATEEIGFRSYGKKRGALTKLNDDLSKLMEEFQQILES